MFRNEPNVPESLLKLENASLLPHVGSASVHTRTAMADSERDHDHREIVARLHTDFHRVAARVAELALSGNQVEAQKLMDVDGEFTHASAKLTLAMMTWKHALAGELAPGST